VSRSRGPVSSDRGHRPGDYFSKQAAEYALYRPHYPPGLFAYYASLVTIRDLAWDCATGSGQAAVPLTDYFNGVVATDLSESQIRSAARNPHVQYAVASSGATCLADRCADLVTVAQALHWFDLDGFYAELDRVLKPGGVFAVSSYDSATIDDPALQERYADFEWGTLGDFWPPRRKLVGMALRDFEFPYTELTPSAFTLQAHWTLAELIGYVRSWSATASFIAQMGSDPTPDLERALRPAWGDPGRRRLVSWPFVLRVGRKAR